MPVLLFLTAFVGIFRRLWQVFRSALKTPEFQGLTIITAITLLAGTAFYHQVEGWSRLDSFYFAVITLTTVGYGDFSPQTTPGKVFTIFYILFGLGIIAGFISTFATHMVDYSAELRRQKQAAETDNNNQPVTPP